MDGKVEDGGTVDVRTFRGRWIGRGFINENSSLVVRLLTAHSEDINEDFFRRRLQSAIAYRQRVMGNETAYRVVYGEADFLPGLIVDRYQDVLVVQTLALGMDRHKAMLADLLTGLLQPAGIYERNDSTVRRLEGLPAQVGWLRLAPAGTALRGEADALVEIREHTARFLVDVARGQKTGFFLDQRENRLATAAAARSAEVFDAFCYTGGFAIQAARAGARRVTAIDISAEAVDLARRNADLNGVADRCSFSVGNAFDELRRLAAEGARYDVVILDPPAFAKSKEALPRAIAGYKEINLRALKLLRSGGMLVSCSCSYHMSEPLLLQVVASAAADAHRSLRLMESRGQARDHPVHPAMPETRYLTCLMLGVV